MSGDGKKKKTKEIEVIELKDKIFRDVLEAFGSWNEPMKLRLLGQRYGRRLKTLGCPPVDEIVRADERLELLHVTTGGRVVLPRQAFAAFTNDMASQTGLAVLSVRANLLRAFNVRGAW